MTISGLLFTVKITKTGTNRMKYLIASLAVLLSVGVSASDVTDKLQQQFADEYAEMSESCGQWADEEKVAAADRNAYVQKCIEDEIGHLVSDEGGSESSENKE